MNWTLEVVVVPVSDLDRAKAFYADQLGFHLDHDTQVGPTRRIIQLTPPGSGCSVVLGLGLTRMAPGSLQGLQLMVGDLRAARAELIGRGVEVSEIQLQGAPPGHPLQASDDLNYRGFFYFRDPDGNSWAVQQIKRQ
ncbi:glyoxalase [Deinococcus irradiatisoli]|uniref:Glyoxalase n=1 Tax=Deinococcus irradiatisoli TaxID=2202254 RepID=A0A2Z3JJA7_9DEIO|nr:VOC family protein [Deinococcus irradiatisoli]AWN23671.1 glyoxalase [Deinococcus irradiatisoli]